ncbi:MAG: hypothetical protein ACJ0SL_07755 [Candidatus Rariloculaceae bacterium]
MSSSASGLFGNTNTGSYLGAAGELIDEMTLLQRGNLIYLDSCLHELWGLGQNVILNWCPEGEGIAVLMVPHYSVATYADEGASARIDTDRTHSPSEDFFKTLISGRRCLTPRQMHNVATLLGIEKLFLPLRTRLTDDGRESELIEQMIKRYSISYVANRAVALFDIVGFSLLTPFEQMTQLNSLSYSVNSAQSKLLGKEIGIDFGRSTTGDGFYLWNRDLGLNADINLYHFMHLVLADNAIARRKGARNTVPKLRAGFHIGSCYEFHQAEGLNPTVYNYIVGDVTVELARMIDRALPGQILVGEFSPELLRRNDPSTDESLLGSLEFVVRATESLEQLSGLELSGEKIGAIKCYLTGAPLETGGFSVRRIAIHDKHGISRNVFNAKVNIYRQHADAILLGIEDRTLAAGEMAADHYDYL